MAKPKKVVDNDEGTHQCVWRDDGYQCQAFGHLSNSTNGTGPWYCRPHYHKLMDWEPPKPETAQDMSQAAVDERVNKIIPRKAGESEHAWSMRCKAYVLDFVRKPFRGKKRDWADQIMARVARGEEVSNFSWHAAKEVVAMRKSREPGEDQVDT